VHELTRLAQRAHNKFLGCARDVLYQIHIMSLYRMRESVLHDLIPPACITHALAQKYIPSLYSNASRRRAHKAAQKLFISSRVRREKSMAAFFVCMCTFSLASYLFPL
jgi:hypothetical protein